jgi:predicted GNAT family acetyltransferase
MEDVRIVHDEHARRYELHVGAELATIAEYRPSDDVWVFHHTETMPSFRGRGLAERLVRFALDDVRSRGKTVVPSCWFVADVMQANSEYADLLAG